MKDNMVMARSQDDSVTRESDGNGGRASTVGRICWLRASFDRSWAVSSQTSNASDRRNSGSSGGRKPREKSRSMKVV